MRVPRPVIRWIGLLVGLLAAIVVSACTSSSTPPPTVETFTASEERVYQPSPQAVLRWETDGADEVRIEADVGDAPGVVGSDGSLTVRPDASTTYTIVASNASGEVTESVTIEWSPIGRLSLLQVAAGDLAPLSSTTAGSTVDTVFQVYVAPELVPDLAGIEVRRGDTVVTNLVDDGSLPNGDDVLGDSVYSGRQLLEFTTAGEETFEVIATIAGEDHSVTATLYVTEGLPDGAFDDVANAHAWAASFVDALPAGTDASSASAALLSDLQANKAALGLTDVTSEGDTIVVLHHDSGLESVVQILDADLGEGGAERGGSSTAASSPAHNGDSAPRAERRRSASESGRLDATTGIVASDVFQPAEATFSLGESQVDGLVENRSALIWTPFAAQFAPYDETTELMELLESSPLGFTVDVLTNQAATVASLRSLTDYGYVVMGTHGVGGEWLQTADAVTEERNETYESDLSRRVMRIWSALLLDVDSGDLETTRAYAVGAEWFDENLAGTFAESILVNNSCESTLSDALWDVFEAHGAGAYFGYDAVVGSAFAVARAVELTEALAVDGSITYEAFVPRAEAGTDADWEMRGRDDLRFAAGLVNGDFENALVGWRAEGDGRPLYQIGTEPHAQRPTQGDIMAVISSGLGFTPDRGSIEQTFFLDADAATLAFDWNFISEEFLEFIGSAYQDEFAVTIVDAEGVETTLLSFSINSVAAEFGAVDCLSWKAACVAEGGELTRGWDFASGTQYLRFDVGDTWYTGWQSVAGLDVTSYAGQVVTLRFSASDVTDDIFDTAVLIDNVRIE